MQTNLPVSASIRIHKPPNDVIALPRPLFLRSLGNFPNKERQQARITLLPK
jgi:hypothetical protein